VDHPSFDKWIPLQYDNDNGIKTDESHRCPNKPYYVSNKDTSHSTNILPMSESEEEVAAALDAKVLTEDTVSKEDRIIDMINRMMIKLDRLLGLLEGKKGNNN
jgi:uncharacterized protein (DUF1499 family)